jgi:hypothetical protein
LAVLSATYTVYNLHMLPVGRKSHDSIQGVESGVDFGNVRMKEVLERLPDALNILNTGKNVDHSCCSTYGEL